MNARRTRTVLLLAAILLAASSTAAAVDADELLKDFDVPSPNEGAYPLRDFDVHWLNTYVDLWWVVLLAVCAIPGLYAAAWISADCAKVGNEPLKWNLNSTVMLGAGALLYALLPPYASGPLLLIATLLLVRSYVPVRNAKVIPSRQLFTPEHRAALKRSLLEKFGIKPKGRAEQLAEVAKVQTPVGLMKQSGQVVSPAEAKHEERDPMMHVKEFFAEAADRRAREAYVVPEGGRYETSFKVDGMVYAGKKLDLALGRAVLSAVRQMVDAESEDPHFVVGLPTRHRRMRFHVAFFGEGGDEWLRLKPRDEEEPLLKLTELGLTAQQGEPLRKLLDRGTGLLAVASPPEMGSRTTVYAMLNSLDPFSRNIATFENPVMGHLASIEQNDLSKSGAPLDEMLEEKLRSDYDVLMFSELSTKFATESALTSSGREQLVIARFEVGEELEVIARLLKLGVEASTIADGLKCVIVQRLVRRLCERCRLEVAPNEEVLRRAGVDPSKVERLWEANASGCEACAHTGFHGRLGIFSTWLLGDKGRRLIGEKAHVQELREAMRKEGAGGLQRAGLLRVLEGKTTLQELARVLK